MKLFLALIFILLYSYTSSAQSWIRCSNGLPQDTAVFSLAKIGNTLYAGTQHAGVYKSIDEGVTWVTTNLENPIRMATVRSLTTIDTFLFAGQSANGVARTSLNSNSWTEVNTGISNGNGNQIIVDIISVGDTLYAAAYGDGVYISIDKGDHWTILHNNQGLNDLHVLSLAANDDFLFAGTAGTNYTMPDTGVAFVTPLTNGDSWSLINNGLVRNGAHLEQVFAMTANDSLVFAGTDDVGIHRSTDNGQTWIRIPTTNLNGDIWSIKIIGHQVYYGTLYHGIFISNDTGFTFYENNAGLNYNGISIPDLVSDFVVLGNYIYAGATTGVYKQLLDPTTGFHQPTTTQSISVTVIPNPFSGETSIQIISDHINEQVSILIMDVFGKKVKEISHFMQGNADNIKLDLSQEPKGIFFYFILNGNKVIHHGKLLNE